MNARVKREKLPLTEDAGTCQKQRQIRLDKLKSTVPCLAFLKLLAIRWIDVLQSFEMTDHSTGQKQNTWFDFNREGKGSVYFPCQ